MRVKDGVETAPSSIARGLIVVSRLKRLSMVSQPIVEPLKLIIDERC